MVARLFCKVPFTLRKFTFQVSLVVAFLGVSCLQKCNNNNNNNRKLPLAENVFLVNFWIEFIQYEKNYTFSTVPKLLKNVFFAKKLGIYVEPSTEYQSFRPWRTCLSIFLCKKKCSVNTILPRYIAIRAISINKYSQ